MTDENLFNEPETVIVDPEKNYLEEYVREGGKFHAPTQEEALQKLARGKYESDGYIKILERRLDNFREDNTRLREETKAQASVREMLDQYKAQPLASSEETPANEVSKPALDSTEVRNLISEEYNRIRITEKQNSNYETVVSELQKRYGPNYQSVLEQHITELDLTKDDVNRMARTNPKALLRLLPEPSRQNFDAPPRSTQRSDPFSPSTPRRTWSYYEKMRKEDPARYSDPKTAVQMEADYRSLGDAFEDGNFRQL